MHCVRRTAMSHPGDRVNAIIRNGFGSQILPTICRGKADGPCCPFLNYAGRRILVVSKTQIHPKSKEEEKKKSQPSCKEGGRKETVMFLCRRQAQANVSCGEPPGGSIIEQRSLTCNLDRTRRSASIVGPAASTSVTYSDEEHPCLNMATVIGPLLQHDACMHDLPSLGRTTPRLLRTLAQAPFRPWELE